MAPKKPPKPSCPPHNYVKTAEGDGKVTHTCTKCKDSITREQGRTS